jgi:hypothetical protein
MKVSLILTWRQLEALTLQPLYLLSSHKEFDIASLRADLVLDPRFINAGCRAHQVVRLMDFSSTGPDLKLSIRFVARVFNINHSAVKRVLLRGCEDPLDADDTTNFHPKLSTPWWSGSPRRYVIIKLFTGQNY